MVSESNGSDQNKSYLNNLAPLSEESLPLQTAGGKGIVSYVRTLTGHFDKAGDAPSAQKYQKDIALQLAHSEVLYIKDVLSIGDCIRISTLGSGLGGHPLSYSTQYGHGLFEGIKFVQQGSKVLGFHFADNFERMKEGCQRLGYDFNYPIDKLIYSTFILAGLNGWLVDWPKINGKPAYIIYGRPIITQPLDGNIGVVGEHAKEMNIIAVPFQEYFGAQQQKSGINVLIYDTTKAQPFSSDENAVKHSSNYSWPSQIKKAASEIPGVMEICFFKNGNMKGDGTGDNFGLITEESVIFPHISTGRLNGITARYVEAISPHSGYNVAFGSVALDDVVLGKGLLALGNAVDKNGVNIAYVPEEYHKYITDEKAKEKWASLKKETHIFDGKPMEMRVLELHTMETQVYRDVKAAFEKRFSDYSLAADDLLVKDAPEILYEVGKVYKAAMPFESLEWREFKLPNLLRDDAPSLISDKGLYPRPFKRIPIETWRKQLQAKKVFSVPEGYGFKKPKLILTK